MKKNRKKLVYISGKITGDDNYKQKFDEAAKLLSDFGFTPINPTVICDPKWTYTKQMHTCLNTLFKCDAIYLLDDWRESRGATAEYYVAECLGIKKLFIKDTKKENKIHFEITF